MKYNECSQFKTGSVNNARQPGTIIKQTNGGFNGRKFDPGSIDMSTHKQPPLYRKSHSIPITVKRFFTDVNGTIIAKGAAVAALQVAYPFWTLGDFDLKGGFAAGLKSMPPIPGTYYLLSFIEGMPITSQQITGFTGANNLRQRLKIGDIVHVYTDDLDAPTNFVWLVQSSRNGSLGSIIANCSTCQSDNKIGPMGIEHIQYFTDNQDPQWRETLHYIRSSNIGSVSDDQINPYTFKSPTTEQDGFIRIKTEVVSLNQYQSIGTYFLFATEEIQLNYLIREY